MSRSRLTTALVAMMLSAPVVAQNQPEPQQPRTPYPVERLDGSQAVKPTPTPKPKLSGHPEDFAVQAVHNMGACIADNSPQGAIALLALDYQSETYNQKLHQLGRGNENRCIVRGVMRSSQMLMAGAIAERLLVRKQSEQGFERAIAYDAGKPAIPGHGMAEVMGMCLARAKPADTWALFATDPTTSAEMKVVQRIAPSVEDCVKQGEKLTLSVPALRASLALGAYRLAHAGDVAPGAKG